MKTEITRAEYLQLLGLEVLAKQYSKKVDDVRQAIYELLETSDEEDKRGHVSDLVWAGDSMDVNKMLEWMGVTVLEGETDAVR